MTDIKRTERGWAGHYILANRCLFRRNTLLQYAGLSVVVSTVGLQVRRESLIDPGVEASPEEHFETVGSGRYFETQAFHAMEGDRWLDADVCQPISLNSPHTISEIDADDRANNMHEAVVAELSERLLAGEVLT